MRALAVHAGPGALAALRERGGLRAADIRAIPAAAGGPKGLILNPLDQFLFGHWLRDAPGPVHLLGASIGAWRMAAACLDDPAAALAQMADDYIRQRYDHAPGRRPEARQVSAVLGATLEARLGVRADEVLRHPKFRLHVFTSRGRALLNRDGRRFSSLTTPLGHIGAFAFNVAARRAMGAWWQRVVFSDPRDPLPLRLDDYATHRVALDGANLVASVLASCSIPIWLAPVRDPVGAPRGLYWDGGITDYHLHLDYASIAALSPTRPALVLYPHFQASLVPGWLDKALKHRHRATARLANVVLLSPRPEWVATLPNGKLPDRTDFIRYGDDLEARAGAWTLALRESARLADEFAEWVQGGVAPPVEPLR